MSPLGVSGGSLLVKSGELKLCDGCCTCRQWVRVFRKRCVGSGCNDGDEWNPCNCGWVTAISYQQNCGDHIDEFVIDSDCNATGYGPAHSDGSIPETYDGPSAPSFVSDDECQPCGATCKQDYYLAYTTGDGAGNCYSVEQILIGRACNQSPGEEYGVGSIEAYSDGSSCTISACAKFVASARYYCNPQGAGLAPDCGDLPDPDPAICCIRPPLPPWDPPRPDEGYYPGDELLASLFMTPVEFYV